MKLETIKHDRYVETETKGEGLNKNECRYHIMDITSSQIRTLPTKVHVLFLPSPEIETGRGNSVVAQRSTARAPTNLELVIRQSYMCRINVYKIT